MPTLTLDHVTYTYGKNTKPALDAVSCTFTSGTVYAVVGPSGSGKSTLLAMLSGLDRPTGGVIALDGASLADLDLDKYRREDATVIFQAFQLFPLLTVLENVCFPLELRGVSPAEAKPQAEELLGRVGIAEELWKRYPSHLSGGEQQRVAIARSIASGAHILLCDEPTGNLDTENTKIVMDLLCSLAHESGCCVIVVTHDPEVAASADRVFRLVDGVLRQENGEE